MWVNETKLLASTCSSDNLPAKSCLVPTPLVQTPTGQRDNHSALYIQYECTEIGTDSNNYDNDISEIAPPIPQCSVADTLMKKANHYPSTIAANDRKSEQFNAIVNHIKLKRYGVRVGALLEYEKLVTVFADILWEIDPHYEKFEKRYKRFPETVVKCFLHFNDPRKHKHAVKNINRTSLSLDIVKMMNLNDRKFMSFMKPFSELISKTSKSIRIYQLLGTAKGAQLCPSKYPYRLFG